MNDNMFFKPTPLYKEFIILDLIDKGSNITQRIMSDYIGASVSMINYYLAEYEVNGYINRKYLSTKTVEYYLTKKGVERKKLLNIWYLKSTNLIYSSAKENIINFINQFIKKGFKKILLYGAGEVAEIILQVINDDDNIPLEVMAVIDDDPRKDKNIIVNLPIISSSKINDYDHDGILISSYKHHSQIKEKLIVSNYSRKKIIEFFDN